MEKVALVELGVVSILVLVEVLPWASTGSRQPDYQPQVVSILVLVEVLPWGQG